MEIYILKLNMSSIPHFGTRLMLFAYTESEFGSGSLPTAKLEKG